MTKNQITWLLLRLSGLVCLVIGLLKAFEAGTFFSLRWSIDDTVPSGQFFVGVVPEIFIAVVGVYLLGSARFVFRLLTREDK